LGLIALLATFRLIYLFLVPLDLVHDEAYYWDWSRQLDWGYYSKPPMIAWLIALATQLGGSTAIVVRLPAVLIGTVGLYLVYLLGARLYGPKVGFFGTLICAVTPGNAALSLLMTIDVPLLLFWMLTIYALWRYLEQGSDRAIWLLTAIAACGLGFLSKQTMAAAFAATGLFLVVSPADRHQWRRPGPYVWVVGAVAFLAPVVWWNAQHAWITLQHTSQHFEVASTSLPRRLIRCAEFVLGQVGVLSPVTCGLTLATLMAACFAFRRLGRRERFLLCFSAAPLFGVFCLSLLRRVEPNWPAVFYPTAIILMVAWAVEHVPLRVVFRRENALRNAITVGLICTLITYAVPFLSETLNLQQARLDPTVRLQGWSELGRVVSDQLQQLPNPQRTFVIVTTDRAATSELAFYLEGQPTVFLWTGSPHVDTQYDIWGGPRQRAGWDAAILTRPNQPVPAQLATAFQRIENHAQVTIPISANRAHAFRIWHATGFRSWP
jgi:undecaprenyl-diphosphatase